MTKIYSKIIIINEKFKKQFFFSCILHDSVSHEKPEEFWNNSHLENMRADFHSGCLDPKKILSTIDPPPGVPGVSKNHIFFSTNETVFPLR